MNNKKIFIKKILPFLLMLMSLNFSLILNFNNLDGENKIMDKEVYKAGPISPILIDDTLPGSDWAWASTQPWFSGGSGLEGDPYLLKDLVVDGGGVSDCISILNSIAYFKIQNCTVFNTGGSISAGIYLNNVSNGILFLNNCSNIDYGINLYDSCYNHIEGNFMYGGSSAAGINLQLSHNNTIGNNEIKYKYQGIRLETSSDNLIVDNIAEENVNFGILLMTSSHHNTVIANTAKNQFYECGIMVLNSEYNTISENFLSGNHKSGIGVNKSNFNNFSANTISGNAHGIYLSNASHNQILNNDLINNYIIGAAITLHSNDNLVFNNFFFMNGNHAFDFGLNNDWNSLTIGNYWDNYTYSDDDNDGIGDNPHDIPGNSDSKDFLPIWDETPPIIDIINPIPNSVFEDTPPNYLVNIYDPYLDTTWYTLDGGINNITFTTNGTIDVTRWSALDDGPVSIIFYANDTFLHTAFSDVVVVKDTEEPVISIIKPNTNDTFIDPPLYEIAIIEVNLDKIWYTLNNGNKTFITELSDIFNPDLWSELPYGNIIVRFYANDSVGNISYDEIIIIKQQSLPPPPPNGIFGYNLLILLGLAIFFTIVVFKRNHYIEKTKDL